MSGMLPWTYSKYELYETCPKKYHSEQVTKQTPFVETTSVLWGREVHTAFEDRVRDGRPLAERMLQFEPMAQAICEMPGHRYCELKTGVNSRYQSVDFWSREVWNRGVEDLVIIYNNKGLSLDYKSGTRKTSRQLVASAARLIAMFPEVTEWTTGYLWLQTGKIDKQKFLPSELDSMWGSFKPGLIKMQWSFDNDVWPARPSGLCKKSRRPGSDYPGCMVADCPFSEAYVQ